MPRLSQSASTAFEVQSNWLEMKVEFLRRAPKWLSRRFTVSLDRGASRAHFQRLSNRKQQHLIETLTVVTRGRVGARQVLVSSWSSRLPKNKRTLSFNFKCHPQAPTFLVFRHICPLTISRSGCELQAPEAILGLLHRGAKGVAVVTRLFSPDLESGWHGPRGHARSRSTRSATLDLAGSPLSGAPRGRVLRSVQLAGTRCRAIAPRHRSSTHLVQHTSCGPHGLRV